MNNWEVRVINHIGDKDLYACVRELPDGTIETHGGHYTARYLAETLADVMNKDEEKKQCANT